MAPPRGRLLNSIEVTIEPVNKTDTSYDRTAREPVRQVARAEVVTIDAQIVWNSMSDPVIQRAGVEERSGGYLVFLAADLRDLAYDPARGDRVRVPDVATEIYLTSFEPTAYRGGSHTLLIANFADKQPTRGATR